MLFSKIYDTFWCGSTNIVFLQTCYSHVGKLMAYVWWFISCYSFAQWISGSYWWLAMYNWFIFLELKAYAVLSSLFSGRHTVELQQKCLVRFVVGWLHTFSVCVYYTGLTKSYWGFSNHTHTKLCQYHLVKCVTFLLVTVDTYVTSSNLIFSLKESSLGLPIKQRIFFKLVYSSFPSVLGVKNIKLHVQNINGKNNITV